MKIGFLIRYYFCRKMILENKCFPHHHFWGYDYLQSKGFDLVEVNPNDCDLASGLYADLFSQNRCQQKQMIKNKDVDIIYVPFFFDCYWIAFLRMMRIYKKPVITIAQETWDTSYIKNPLRKIIALCHKCLAKYGVDRLLFISPNLIPYIKGNFRQNGVYGLEHWGVDIDYFDNFIALQNKKTQQYIYFTGGSNRDVNVVVEAAKMNPSINFYFQSSKASVSKIKCLDIPVNMVVNTNCSQQSDLLPGYYNSLCVLVPLLKKSSAMTGITVIFEAMAMGKPVISTRSLYYPFDIEKEGVGLYVDYNNAEELSNAIRFLHENPKTAIEMGQRGRDLVEKKYNYKLFCEELEHHINDMTKQL